MNDWQIQEQAYGYFLAEAPELLQTIEQEILTLPNEHTTPKVHNLMRALHTLKGAAASVNLEMIKTFAHELEDIVRVFYNLEVAIEPEIQSWLLEGYSALHSALDARILGLQIDEEVIRDGFQRTISRLKDRLGDRLAVEVELPTSIELGFDFVASIFETDVREQIDSLETALADGDGELLSNTLQCVVEICTGLAESVELEGFMAISKAIGSALSQHPDQLEQIAHLAITNLELARTEVLGGDRTHGGHLLPELGMLSEVGNFEHENLVIFPSIHGESELWEVEEGESEEFDPRFSPIDVDKILVDRDRELAAFRSFLTSDHFRTRQPLSPATQDFMIDLIRLCWDWFEQCVDTRPNRLELELLIAAEGLPDLDYINHWVDLLLSQIYMAEDSSSLQAYRRSCLDQVVFAVAKYLAEVNPKLRISSEFLETLRSQLQRSVIRAKQEPPITATEKAWLEGIILPHTWHPFPRNQTRTTTTSDDDLLNQIWGQPQLLDRRAEQHPLLVPSDLSLSVSLPDEHPQLVPASILNDLSDCYRYQCIHTQQLRSLLMELYPQGSESPSNHDLESASARVEEDLALRLSLANQALEQIEQLLDRQQQLIHHLDPMTMYQSAIINN